MIGRFLSGTAAEIQSIACLVFITDIIAKVRWMQAEVGLNIRILGIPRTHPVVLHDPAQRWVHCNIRDGIVLGVERYCDLYE